MISTIALGCQTQTFDLAAEDWIAYKNMFNARKTFREPFQKTSTEGLEFLS